MKTRRTLNKAIRLTKYNSSKRPYLSLRSKKHPGVVYYIKPRFFFFLTAILALITAIIYFTIPTPVEEEYQEPASIIIEQPTQEQEITVTATYYCGCSICCGVWSEGYEDIAHGKAGTLLTPYYSIATDPEIIPTGTILHDKDGNEYEAVDTGNYIKGNRIDIFTGNHQEALQLGRQEIILYY